MTRLPLALVATLALAAPALAGTTTNAITSNALTNNALTNNAITANVARRATPDAVGSVLDVVAIWLPNGSTITR